MLPMFAMMFIVMYFLVMRPQSKQRKERESMISNTSLTARARYVR